MPAVRLFRVTGGTVNPEPDPPDRPAHVIPVRRSHHLRGEPPPALTPRQREVLTHSAHGDISEEIAQQIGCTFYTVDNHLKMIRLRLNARNTPHAVAIALTNGWIRLTAPEP